MIDKKNTLNKSTFIFFPIFLALYEIAIYLSNDAYLPALPFIGHDLSTTQQLTQLTLTMWFMGSASMQLILGPMADVYGRRSVLFYGGIIFIATTIGCSLTDNITVLLFIRFIQGATVTSMVVSGYATIHDVFSQKQAIHTLGLMNSIIILAPAFGPLFGAMVLHFLSWRWIFAILGIWSALALIALFFIMPTSKGEHQSLHLGRTLLEYKRILTNKTFMLHLLTSRCLFAAMIAWITASPFLLVNTFHYTPSGFGIIQVFIFGCFILGNRIVKQLMNFLELNIIIKIGISLAFLAGLYAFISSMLSPTYLWNLVAGMMLFAAGTGLVFPILERLAIESSKEAMGSRVAISSSMMGISGMLGSAIISLFYKGTLFEFSSVLLSLCCGSLLFFFLQYKIFPQEPSE